jgi:hypothetical protein
MRDEGNHIVSGVYMMEGLTGFAVCPKMDNLYYKVHDGRYKFLDKEMIQEWVKENYSEKGECVGEKLMSVDFCGFGFIMIKPDVFHSLGYPWFKPWVNKIDEDIREVAFEDVSFCHYAKQKGYATRIDPLIIVGHEKKVIL